MKIECEGLTKSYFAKRAVDQVNLELTGGHIYALLGPNGSGKSTLMKILSGLVKKSEGSISVDGKQLDWRAREDISYTPTEPFFYSYMKVSDVAAYYDDFFKDFDRARFYDLIKDMEISPDMKVRSLSSGMLAKVKIAAAMARRSKLILLDEPFNGIDLLSRDVLAKMIIGEMSEGSSLVISSHMVEELESIVDMAVFMKNGRIAEMCDVETLRINENKSIADKYREIYSEV
ncbi:MAG: ABC transporter ATP-binding protein [Lachnospiraceae bacterium]|uniref:ABC transporter ATP-binding protein n=1 Tax=Candidatus Weimeria bifida TaxID=2599074 RepID=A0A6N7IZZ8_9FIRM|nr:ABC transporter ATP-binding protein [Candidatus Weimeria bifida]RRF94767.1 MAG: ABC transporter ATP-binding protein [Lachnospiraceae bacterium]